MTSIDFSIVIPVRNLEGCLTGCLDSVIKQTYKNYEVICIDGNSSDGSRSIISRYSDVDSRIRLIESSCDTPGEARNIGMDSAQGAYLLFLDGDDYLEPDCLECLRDAIERTSADLICFPLRGFSDATGTVYPGASHLRFDLIRLGLAPAAGIVFNRKDEPISTFRMMHFNCCSRIYRLGFLRQTRIRFQDIPYYEEFSFSYKCLAAANRIVALEKPLYYRRLGRKLTEKQGVPDYRCLLISIRDLYSYLNQSGWFKECEEAFYYVSIDSCKRYLLQETNCLKRQRFLEALESDEYGFLNQYMLSESARERIEFGVTREYACMIAGAIRENSIQQNMSLQIEPVEVVSYRGSRDIKVSIIMPVYQAEKYIEETLESLRDQALADIEIICVDDGSSDKSLDILKLVSEADERISVYVQRHAGLAVARNTGFGRARGEYLYYMDADDILEPHALQLAYQEASRQGLDAVYFNATPFYDEACSDAEKAFKPQYSRVYSYKTPERGARFFSQLVENNEYFVPVWAALYKADYIKGLQLKWRQGIIHGDNAYTFKAIINARRVGYIGESLYRRRIHPNSVMTSKLTFESAYGYFADALDMIEALEGARDGLSTDELNNAQVILSGIVRSGIRDYRALNTLEKNRVYGLREGRELFKAIIQSQADALDKKDKLERDLADVRQRKALTDQSLADYEHRNASMNDELLMVKRDNEQLRALLEEAEAKTNTYREKISELESSRSYRLGKCLTKPVRIIKRKFKLHQKSRI